MEEIEIIKEFADGFSKLSPENQLMLLGMLKGMVAANELNSIQPKGV
jgi:hypothetical protein